MNVDNSAGNSSRTPANCSTNPKFPSMALAGGLINLGVAWLAAHWTLSNISRRCIMPSTRPRLSVTGSLLWCVSFIISNALCRFSFLRMDITGVTIMSSSVVLSASTLTSLTLLRMSLSVTMPIHFSSSTTRISSSSCSRSLSAATRVDVSLLICSTLRFMQVVTDFLCMYSAALACSVDTYMYLNNCCKMVVTKSVLGLPLL